MPLHPRLARMVVGAVEIGHGALACLLAALLDERDVLRGRPDDVPADVAVRLRLLTDDAPAPPIGRRSCAGHGAAARWRAGTPGGHRIGRVRVGSIPTLPARVLVLGYPDRLAISRSQRGQRGQFQLRAGTGAWVAKTDVLADEPFLAVADLDGDRRQARIRLAAPISGTEVAQRYADQDRGACHARSERGGEGAPSSGSSTGGVGARRRGKPSNCSSVADGLLALKKKRGGDVLSWTAAAISLR